MKTCISIIAATFAAVTTATVPEVSDVTMSQSPNRTVTITYSLANGPAVVTLDIQTNSAENGWVSIGGENISGGSTEKGVPRGDVNKLVEGDTTHTITWRPDVSWPDHKIAAGNARAVVTAWATNDTPDYLVVDLSTSSETRCRYYQAVEFLPGGILSNTAYRTSYMTMRKIRAKNVTWTMGTMAEAGRSANETSHEVTLPNNYYMGVFPVTQAQFDAIKGEMTGLSQWNYPFYPTNGITRPKENVTYTEIRGNPGNSGDSSYVYPNAPHDYSYIGRIRARTGVDFDLPSEAQWEYACRAGHGEGYWGNGTLVASDPIPGRCSENGPDIPNTTISANIGYGTMRDTSYLGPTNGTAVVGSYDCNDWGIYDMNGNVLEYCLDWYADNISSLNGAVNTTPGSNRVVRGGSFRHFAYQCRPAWRIGWADTGSRSSNVGFRLMCRAGLE